MERKRNKADVGDSKAPKKPKIMIPPLSMGIGRVETKDVAGQQALISYLESPDRSHQELQRLAVWMHDHWTHRLANELKRSIAHDLPCGFVRPVSFLSSHNIVGLKEETHGWVVDVGGEKQFYLHVIVDKDRHPGRPDYYHSIPFADILDVKSDPVPFPISDHRWVHRNHATLLTGQVVHVTKIADAMTLHRSSAGSKTRQLEPPLSGVVMERTGLGTRNADNDLTVQFYPCQELSDNQMPAGIYFAIEWTVITARDVVDRLSFLVMNPSLRLMIAEYAMVGQCVAQSPGHYTGHS